ncbi:MAG: TetR/AcrR family transcriptional regulator [Spirochaetota bacterium]
MDFIEADPAWPFSRAKTAVIRAAAAVIREQGPRSATLKNIAGRAGITEPAIFRHFDGVDGLFEGLFFVFERHFSLLSACFSGPGKGSDRFIAGAKATVGVFASNKDFAYLLLHAEHVFRGYPHLRKRIAELRQNDQKAVFSALEEAMTAGQFDSAADIQAVAMAFFGTIHLTVHGWIESEEDFDVTELATHRIEAIQRLVKGYRSQS